LLRAGPLRAVDKNAGCQVDAKIENNGVHVPSAQAKMAKLFSMRSATTKTSNATTTARNGSAVVSGLVQAKRVK